MTEDKEENKIPRKILVLIIAKITNNFEIFLANIWVVNKTTKINITNDSSEKKLIVELIIKNQKENPAVTATDLKRGEDVFILYRIYESD